MVLLEQTNTFIWRTTPFHITYRWYCLSKQTLLYEEPSHLTSLVDSIAWANDHFYMRNHPISHHLLMVLLEQTNTFIWRTTPFHTTYKWYCLSKQTLLYEEPPHFIASFGFTLMFYSSFHSILIKNVNANHLFNSQFSTVMCQEIFLFRVLPLPGKLSIEVKKNRMFSLLKSFKNFLIFYICSSEVQNNKKSQQLELRHI